VRLAPKRASSTVIDTANDPHFEYIGAIPGRLAVSSTDMTYADYLTGGTSQAARNHPRIKFVHTGQAFEAYFRMRGTTFDYRLYVDGLPLTTTLQSTAVTATGPEFGGVAIGPTDSITRPQRAPVLLAGFGDSHTRGANGVGYADTWVRRAANVLHCEWANLGIGGSGYLIDNGTTGANYRNRLTTDVIPLAPDVLVFEGSWNDAGSTSAAVQAEAAFCFDTLKAALPKTLLIAAGPWVVNHTLSTILDGHDAALRAQAQASGWHGYISYRDPLNLKASAPAWAATTAYQVGNVVTQNGYAQKCIVAHTSTGSFDQTKWRSTALVQGTGKVGTTVGDGNADVIVSNDGIHNTTLGHQVKARHVAAEVARIAASIASGNVWAG
jgi:lysophospholipase L1-like esterase